MIFELNKYRYSRGCIRFEEIFKRLQRERKILVHSFFHLIFFHRLMPFENFLKNRLVFDLKTMQEILKLKKFSKI